MSEEIDLKDLFYEIFEIVKFELEFYKNKESPMFERIMRSRKFQSKLKRLQLFIFDYFERMYRNKTNPVTKDALRTQLNNIARITNYYDDLFNFYSSHSGETIDKDKLKDVIEFSHIEHLFIIFTSILDWEHQRKSIFFPTDETKGEILKKFLSSLADSNIRNIDDVVKLEEKLNDFVETIEFFFDYYFE